MFLFRVPLQVQHDSSEGNRVERILMARGGGGSTLRLRISRVSFHCGFQPLVSGCGLRTDVDGRTIVHGLVSVGLPWPIISRGRICLIYYIHCVIHRKRLPTLYCVQDDRGVELNRDGYNGSGKGTKERG